MEDRRGEFFVCVAGYPDNMDTFLKANPGLNSRFDKILRFEDYTPEELTEIAVNLFAERGAKPTPAALEYFGDYLRFLHKYRDTYFGNARTVRQLVIDVINRHDLRLAADGSTDSLDPRQPFSVILKDVDHLKLDTKELSIQRKRIGF